MTHYVATARNGKDWVGMGVYTELPDRAVERARFLFADHDDQTCQRLAYDHLEFLEMMGWGEMDYYYDIWTEKGTLKVLGEVIGPFGVRYETEPKTCIVTHLTSGREIVQLRHKKIQVLRDTLPAIAELGDWSLPDATAIAESSGMDKETLQSIIEGIMAGAE